MMKLHQASVSQNDLYDAIAKALPEDSTLVIADTSLLFWLYGLGKAARAELIAWAEEAISERFKVPVWAAHELHEHIRTNPARLTTVANEIKAVSAKMRDLRRMVSLFADEAKRPEFLDRREYIGALDRAAHDFIKMCNLCGTQPSWAELSAEIVPFVNRHVLGTDIFPTLRWIQGDYAARVVGRVPPGFKDDKKLENKFGDLMLWNEIVDHCRLNHKFTTAIFLTDDNKTDWVFRPETILDEIGKPHKNQKENGYETLLAPPLLTHELATVSRIHQFYIVNTSALAIILERYAGRSIPSLFAAVQPVLPAQSQPSQIETKTARVPQPTKTVAPAALASIVALSELRRPEAEVTATAPALTLLLANLRSRDAGLQEDALEASEQGALAGAPPSAYFLLGQAVSEATRTELQTATSFIHRFESATATWDAKARSALFAGLLFDLYFQLDGKPRPLPLTGDVEAILGVLGRCSVEPAVAAIEAALAEYRVRYLATPGGLRRVPLAFSLLRSPRGQPSELVQVRRDTTELLEDLAQDSDDLLEKWVGSTAAATVADLRLAIAKRFSVPLDWLIADQPDATRVFWTETKGFRAL